MLKGKQLAVVAVVVLSALSLPVSQALGSGCFLAMEDGHVFSEEGNCDERHSPCSTFKIALSLIGFEEGLLADEEHPQVQYKDEYRTLLERYPDEFRAGIERWKPAQTPSSWIKTSCVWYSQLLTAELGMDKLQQYVDQFEYGNKDLSGDPGKGNGLSHCWLSSSLKISAQEQVAFLDKIAKSELAISQRAQQLTRKVLFIENLPGGYKLFGKSGTGARPKPDSFRDEDHQIGWFVGWLEKGSRRISFAYYIEDDEKESSYAGKRAQALAREKLLDVVGNEG